MHGGLKMRPWEIMQLTLPEVALALDEDVSKPRAPSYADAVGAAGVQAYLERRRRMSMRQRLAEAVEKWSQ